MPASIEPLEVDEAADGCLVRFPRGRPWEAYRRFRVRFPAARPEANWTWRVPGKSAGRRLELWRAEERDLEAVAALRARLAKSDKEWEAAAP